MSTENLPAPAVDTAPEETTESFGDALHHFEAAHRKPTGEDRQVDATVVSLAADSVFLDIGFKIEGVLPRSAFENNADAVQPGDVVPVTVKGRNEDGYYTLSRQKIAKVTNWSSLEEAFANKAAISGTVTAVVKGGATVDVGVRAFLPASRSGTRDAKGLEELVGQEITCRITKLDVAEEDVVVDRRVLLEEQAFADGESRRAGFNEGDVVEGTVRSLTDYGAFVDLGGIDGLLHVGDISWTRIARPEDALTVGEKIQAKILKLDGDRKRISLGMKQLLPEPWDTAGARYSVGQRVTGTVSRLADFGAFVELEPGIEGLIHVSEMSWVKRVQKPSDIVKEGDTVEAVVLAVSLPERRLSLGLKQALGDPWADVAQRFPVGGNIEGPVTRIAAFGAFVQLAEGIEGLVHISEIAADRRLAHPSDALRVGEVVKAKVLGIDADKRQIKLSIKQLAPTGLDDFLAEHSVGDMVSGRIVSQADRSFIVELGEAALATCPLPEADAEEAAASSTGAVDLSSLTSMLQSRWKGNDKSASPKREAPQPGQVRSFRITAIDAEAKKIQLQLV